MALVAIDIRLIGNQRTGDEQVFFELTKKLIHYHPEHRYLLLTDKSEAALNNLRKHLEIDRAPAEVELVSFGPVNRFWWNGVTLPKFFLSRKDIDIFHTQYILPFYIPSRIKVVAHIHDVSFVRYPKFIAKKDLFFLRLLLPHTCRRANILAVPSLFTKSEVMALYGVREGKIAVIPNAPGEAFLESLAKASAEQYPAIQSKYQLPEKYLLYVGTLQPRKNIPYLLAMFAEYKKSYSGTENMKLVVVGNRKAHHFDKRIDEAIKRLALEKEVVFPGYVASEDLPFIYKQAHTFIFPSCYEGFGIPPLEALATGLPTLVSDIPVHREIGGEALTYFPLDSIAKAAEILYTISINELKTSVFPKYSWAASAALLALVYQKVNSK